MISSFIRIYIFRINLNFLNLKLNKNHIKIFTSLSYDFIMLNIKIKLL